MSYLPFLFVVPAQAGTSNFGLLFFSAPKTIARGPRLRGDDNGFGVSL